MARGIDEIQVVRLTVVRFVEQGRRLRFDGYPTLFFNVHGVQNLRLHVAVLKPTTPLDQAIGKCRFTVINVSNDGKISDAIHQREDLSS